MNKRPVEGITGKSSTEEIINVLAKYGIENNKVTLWGTGSPLREFLWSEDMADASVHVLLNVDFKDIIGIEKYSSVMYGAKADGLVDRNHSAGRGGAIPALGEIRNCHINVGTGKELTIKENSLVACIIRNGEVIIPNGNCHIQLGDNVIVVTTHKNFDDLADIFN